MPPAPQALDEMLEAAFRRHRPQGTARWNFEVAFTLLTEELAALDDAGGGPVAADTADGTRAPRGVPAPSGARRPLRRVADRLVLARVERWIAARAAAAASDAAARGVRRDGPVATSLRHATEALRFLGARVATLEEAGARRDLPVDGLPWLLEPPDLSPWIGPLTRLLAGRAPGAGGASEGVLHAECGDGRLVLALAREGVAARGVEPRGARARDAAAAGAPVAIGEAGDALAAAGTASLGGLVLSGVVDRLAVGDLVALVVRAFDKLVPGARLVVVSSGSGEAAAGWSAVARDLLPGRPLHPDTWQVLLERAGYRQVAAVEPEGGDPAGAYALGAIRP
ncbi:MAG TPA: hypothetical protein VKV25_05720 [Acidimicrobiales bacterium]|nr:hypothetical protein [Acidimicrobiales bacterium]